MELCEDTSREGGSGAQSAGCAGLRCMAGPGPDCGINTRPDQGSPTLKLILKRARNALPGTSLIFARDVFTSKSANQLQAANSASNFRGLALLFLNPCLILANCKGFT